MTTTFDPQPGDTVVIRERGWHAKATTATVARVTKTQIVVTAPDFHTDRRFRRQDMSEVGDAYGAELLDPTSDTGRRVLNKQRANDALSQLRSRTDRLCRGHDAVTVATLDDLQAALDALRDAHTQLAQETQATTTTSVSDLTGP